MTDAGLPIPPDSSDQGIRLALSKFLAKMKLLFTEEKGLEQEVKAIAEEHQKAVIKNKIEKL
jgi:hypothetical protein